LTGGFSFPLIWPIKQNKQPNSIHVPERRIVQLNPIAPSDSSTPDNTSLPTCGTSYNASESTRVTSSLQQNADVTIITAEGDKVTLSSGSQAQMTYATYEELRYMGGHLAQFRDESLGLEVSREYSISVEGDLNKTELRDIRKAIRTIEKIMRDFLSGDIDHAAGKAMKISRLEFISTLEASLQFERSLSVDQQFTEHVTSEPIESAEDMTMIGDTITSDHIDRPIGEISQVVLDSGVQPAKLLKPIRKVFSRLIQEIPHTQTGLGYRPRLQAVKLIELHLLERIKQLIEDWQNTRQQAIPDNVDEPTDDNWIPEGTDD
jgi:hypothetical protein